MDIFKINDVDSTTMGIYFLEGVYRDLTKLPEPKDTLVNDWADEHGKERDLSARKYKSQTIALPMLVKGSTDADLAGKISALNAILLAGYFNLKCYGINRQFDLVYTGVSSYEYLDRYTCTVTITCENDYPQLNTPI